ncbi:hypothetical protein [Anaeromyxobacter sp. PSR-1]|uniref:hypothetical protein n=1 Tax=unclassified Anaeromyxobacter TaxID=2620896 RepID=UPI0005E645BF|nr:hypothetical protein [Anaeromyxobacter sp. PSR-1]GAO02323.1 hypothetical protein PSR1_01194 [Anaeromyxobacter sp. PSR-1]
MATKAERFRYETERSGPKKAKQPRPPRRDTPVDTSQPGVSATHRKSARHESVRAGKKAQYALEDSAGKPSRKSTRKASNRQKTDSQMRVKRRTGEMRPESRATRGR